MFYSDEPIKTCTEDRLGREEFCRTFAHALLNLNNKDTFSVGLYGEWGSGKTSLINMVLDVLEAEQRNLPKEERFLIFCFEPWNFTDSNQLFRQFFIQLSDKFQSSGDKKSKKIGEALEDYANVFEMASLIPIIGDSVAKAGEKITIELGKKMQKGAREEDVQKLKEHLVKLLQKQDQKILVVIDDIDRLSSEQIRQVFQLISAVAKFPNTIYLVVFDKEIVVNALEKVQEGNGADYLEKIIQMPIELPEIQPEKIRSIFYGYIDEIIMRNKEISFNPDHWREIFNSCINPFISHTRDVKRLCNAVEFKLSGIGSEVDFADMVAISGLQLFLPKIYNWVKDNKPILTEYNYRNDLWNTTQKPSKEEKYKIYNSEFKEILEHESSKKEFTSENVMTLLSKLFPVFGVDVGKYFEANIDALRRNNQIAHPDKFDRYFDLDLDKIEIRKADILKVANSMDEENVREYIRNYDKKDLIYELFKEISAMRLLLPKERAKILVKGILSEELKGTSQMSDFSRNVRSFASNLVIELIDIMDAQVRLDYMIGILHNADSVCLSSMAYVINLIELAYGRFTDNGVEQNYKKILSLEELERLENEFTNKAKSLLREHNLFDFSEWKMVFYLLEKLNPDYIAAYFSNAFQNNKNILTFTDFIVDTWYGGVIGYEVKKDYQKYISEDQILKAIEKTKISGEFFSMPSQIKNKCAAFYITKYAEEKQEHGVEQPVINELLTTWEECYFANKK